MLVGIIRAKFAAVLLGPVGVGLVGTYQATVQLIGTVAGLGLQSSAVRDVADAVGSGDADRVGRIILTLRRMCWLTGVLGSFSAAVFSRHLSVTTFGTPDYAIQIALVGLTILFANVQGGQMAILQGMRRIGDLARVRVVGVWVGSVSSVIFYLWLGMKGIVPAIVLLGFIQLLVAWWYARKVSVKKISMTWRESFCEAGGMLKLGLAFMWSAMLVSVVAYVARILITHQISLVAVGIYSAAYSLSGMIVNFILQAMGADYYPSLTAINKDHSRMRDLINQQTEIGLLLAFPALI
jgi:PST family polysaccharide transporter